MENQRINVLINHLKSENEEVENKEIEIIEENNTKNEENVESNFGDVKLAPADPILGLTKLFKEDSFKQKVNLGVGAYRDENGQPYVLKVVREIEKELLNENLDKEYIPQEGLQSFLKASALVQFGEDSAPLKEGRIVSIQAISGTGALRLGMEFIKHHLPKDTKIYLPNPTWGNHNLIAKYCDIPIGTYRYWDKKNKGLDFKGMLEDLTNAPKKSVVLLHVCAHNPTGVDPTEDQWKEIAKVCKEKKHMCFFDNAYQGYASGDLKKDSFSVRYFVEQGFELMVSQSFAKNIGLYGERIGAIHFVVNNKKTAQSIDSQLKVIVRSIYSSPPLQGARIVSKAILDKKYFKLWQEDMTIMSQRIISNRERLFDELKKLDTPGDWSHITSQIGMFSFTGLTEKQVKMMIDKYHIYMLSNGRISMAGLNGKNIPYVAKAIYDCVTTIKE